MAEVTVTTEQVHELIQQLAAMNVAASITPEMVANIFEKMRNLNDQEREKVIAVAEAFIARLLSIGISGEYAESDVDEIRIETDGGTLIVRINAEGADFADLKRGGNQVATTNQLPTRDTSIGESPSNTHVPTTKAVKEYVDANAMGDLPISEETTQSEDEEFAASNDAGTDTYAKVGPYGVKAKAYKKLNGDDAIPPLDTTIGDNPSNAHTPSTAAVKNYVDSHGGGIGNLPISGETIQDEVEEYVFCNNTETNTYARIGPYGIKSKGYFDEDGNQVIPKIFRCGSTRTYTKVKDVVEAAVQYQNSIVYLDGETFDILAEFGQSYLENLHSGNCGMFLKNGIHIIGTAGTKLLFNYTGSVEVVNKYFSVFNSANEGNGYTLENLTIECKNCRYCVHDDRSIDPDIYFNNFIRCNMKIDNTQNVNWTSNQCIGGGFARHANILIEDCRFISLGQENGQCVTYHNTASDDQTAQSSLIIKGCTMNTTCLITNHGSSPKVSTMMVSNCKLGSNPRAYNNPSNPNNTVEVVYWNIEIANS